MRGPNEACIILEGDDQIELEGKVAQELAKAHATQLGLSPASLSGWQGPYPVLKDGKAVESQKDTEDWHKESVMEGRHVYRNDFKIVCPFPRRGI